MTINALDLKDPVDLYRLITPGSVSYLAEKYQFDRKVLAKELWIIGLEIFGTKKSSEWYPSTKKTKSNLKAMEKLASDLHQRISDIHQPDLINIIRRDCGDIKILKQNLAVFERCISRIVPKSLNINKLIRDLFIQRLARFWQREKGKPATYSTDPLTSNRSGEFITFMTEAAELLGIDPKPLPEIFVSTKREFKGTDNEI